MTETEWLECGDLRLLDWALERGCSTRKWSLFFLACLDPLASYLTAESKEVVAALSRAAEGHGSRAELDRTGEQVRARWGRPMSTAVEWPRVWIEESADAAARYAASYDRDHSAAMAVMSCTETLCRAADRESRIAVSRQATRRHLCLIRDVFGNPFRPATFFPEWQTDTALSLARQMYESCDFSAMPILADALQDAGCDSAEILDHCRGPGPHVRGCWVVDLVLGKE
jgi:hypothetical protein